MGSLGRGCFGLLRTTGTMVHDPPEVRKKNPSQEKINEVVDVLIIEKGSIRKQSV
jgi:hypothetical protein